MKTKYKTLIEIQNKLVIEINDIKLKNKVFENDKDYKNKICEYLDLNILEDASFTEEGYIIKNNIFLNADISYEQRKNFTFFHEVSHFLINRDEDILDFLDFYCSYEKNIQKNLELLANIGAAEFLLPSKFIKDFLQSKKFTIKNIKELDLIFNASRPAIIYKLANLVNFKSFFVIINSKIENGNLIYYIEHSTFSKNNHLFLKNGTIILKDHILVDAYINKTYLHRIDYIPYANNNKNHKTDCEAYYYKGKVYGVFYLEKPVDYSLQMKLF